MMRHNSTFCRSMACSAIGVLAFLVGGVSLICGPFSACVQGADEHTVVQPVVNNSTVAEVNESVSTAAENSTEKSTGDNTESTEKSTGSNTEASTEKSTGNNTDNSQEAAGGQNGETNPSEEPAPVKRLDLDGTFLWDDPIEPLSSEKVLDELEADQKRANILFVTGRDLEKRSDLETLSLSDEESDDLSTAEPSEGAEDSAGRKKANPYSRNQRLALAHKALKQYQRACRLDPSPTIYIRIAEMACKLERYSMGQRYVDQMIEEGFSLERMDPMLLRQLAAGLTQNGDIKHAYDLYKAILKRVGYQLDPQAVILNLEGAKYAYLMEDYQQAAISFDLVFRAARQPQEYGLTPRLVDLLEIERPETIRLAADAFLLAKKYTKSAIFFEMANALDKNTAELAYHKARIAVAEDKFSDGMTWLSEALNGDLSGEGEEPFTLLFKIGQQSKTMPQAEALLKKQIDKTSNRLTQLENRNRYPKSSAMMRYRNAIANRKVNSLLTDMDLAGWTFYCRRLHEAGKSDEALKMLQRIMLIKPNIDIISLQLQIRLERHQYVEAIRIMALLYKVFGTDTVSKTIVTEHLSQPENRQQFLVAAKELLNRFNTASSSGNKSYTDINSDWSVYHSGVVGLALLETAKTQDNTDAADASGTIREQPEEKSNKQIAIDGFGRPASAFVAEIQPFMDFALRNTPKPIPPKSKAGKNSGDKNNDGKNNGKDNDGRDSESGDMDSGRPTMDSVLSRLKALWSSRTGSSQSKESAGATNGTSNGATNGISTAGTTAGAGSDTADDFNVTGIALVWGFALVRDQQYRAALDTWLLGQSLCDTQDKKYMFDYYLCGALVLLDRTDEAIKRIDGAIAANPDDCDYALRKAWVIYLDDQHDAAATIYEQIIARFDDQYDSDAIRESVREARSLLATIYDTKANDPSTDAAAKAQYNDQSSELLEQILDEFPDNIGAMNDLAYFWSVQGRNLRRALIMSRKTVKAQPDTGAYLDTLGWIHYCRGEFPQAIEYLKKAVDLHPDPIMIEHLGDAYKANNQIPEARQAWEKALQQMDKAEKPVPEHQRQAVEKKLAEVR